MARLILDYYKGESEYSDGDIETELLQIVKQNSNYDEVLRNDSRWPVVYHLSHLRRNILNWYHFRKNCEILEVGAGCGALTGALCERAAHVTAVELTKRRATIDYERNKNADNLDIYVGDIFKMNFDGKFDYVTVNGVLEYAAFMSNAGDPYADFLNKVKSYLKPGGHILIAIENRLGLKYFAGAREDHTGKFFDGVNGYDKDSRVRTFTKFELEALLSKAGLSRSRFYYPLPDYKFPSCIMTDETINNFDSYLDFGSHDSQRFEIFNELRLTHQFAKEGVLGQFANSFLIDVVCDGDKDAVIDSSVLMAKLSAARKPQYRIATVIKRREDGVREVVKLPLTQSCAAHLKRMADFYDRYKNINGMELVPCRVADGGAVAFDFARGRKFSDLIEEAICESKKEAELAPLWQVLDLYRSRLFEGSVLKSDFYTDKFVSYFGEKKADAKLACISPANVDMIFDNIFIDSDRITAVDYEWIVECGVPAEYIFWRSVFMSDIFRLHEDLREGIYEHYGITQQLKDVFFSWELSFSLSGIGGTALHFEPCVRLDLNALEQTAAKNDVAYSLCFDRGAGCDPSRPDVTGTGKMGEAVFIKAVLDADINAVRFDPLEGSTCQCRIISAFCGERRIKIRPLNSIAEKSGEELFFTVDPVYIIEEGMKKGDTIEITYVVNPMDASLAQNAVEKQRIDAISCRNELENLRGQYDALIKSKSWKLTAPLRNVTGALNHRGNK